MPKLQARKQWWRCFAAASPLEFDSKSLFSCWTDSKDIATEESQKKLDILEQHGFDDTREMGDVRDINLDEYDLIIDAIFGTGVRDLSLDLVCAALMP